ncbi:MAG TPA: hypothetical protein ENI99_05225 [Sedimenticola sp.]|nr:hypothetical protein [Sedimenticola sp.]
MQGTVAQLLSLAAHGNEYLAGNLEEKYFPNNSTFMFCKYVKFVDLQSSGTKWHERDFAPDPISWFKKLKETGVIQFRVRYISTNNEQISDRMSIAFVGGGGRWLIEAVKPGKSDFWEAHWEVGDQNDPDSNIWHVKYGRILRNTNHPESPLPPASEIKNQLKHVLKKIRDFAFKHDHSNFGEIFNNGIKALSDKPSNYKNEYKIFPENYAASEYHQLINACQRAWVFGGMGSWNDIGFNKDEVHKEYEALSDELFNIINLSLIVASNPLPRPSKKQNTVNDKHNKKWWEIWKKG